MLEHDSKASPKEATRTTQRFDNNRFFQLIVQVVNLMSLRPIHYPDYTMELHS